MPRRKIVKDFIADVLDVTDLSGRGTVIETQEDIITCLTKLSEGFNTVVDNQEKICNGTIDGYKDLFDIVVRILFHYDCNAIDIIFHGSRINTLLMDDWINHYGICHSNLSLASIL